MQAADAGDDGDADGTRSVPASPMPLCAGDADSMPLGFVSAPPSQTWRGTLLLDWFPMFYVQGDCKAFFAYDSWRDVRTKTLSPEELRDLYRAVEAARWAELEEHSCNGLIDGSGSRNAPLWMGPAPSQVGAADPEPVVQMPEGELADRIRAARASWLKGNIGTVSTAFIPVLDSDGNRYELRVREATPADQADSSIIPR